MTDNEEKSWADVAMEREQVRQKIVNEVIKAAHEAINGIGVDPPISEEDIQLVLIESGAKLIESATTSIRSSISRTLIQSFLNVPHKLSNIE